MRTPLPWVKHDGNRSAEPRFGGVSPASDCAVRAIAIASRQPYGLVYEDLTAIQKDWAHTSRSKGAKAVLLSRKWHARHGVHREVLHTYFRWHGWDWVPTMGIGTGTTVHMAEGELPDGRLVVNLSKHLAAVVHGSVYDTHDPCRGGDRAVYGYWRYPEGKAEHWVDTMLLGRDEPDRCHP